jgi:hypothetical protein
MRRLRTIQAHQRALTRLQTGGVLVNVGEQGVLAISTEKGAFSVIAEQGEDAPEFVGDTGGIAFLLLPAGMQRSPQ